MANVKLTNVKKVYQGGVVAVDDFNLDIKDKEFIVFVGPSGCGKSTTLRMVAGLEDISGGTIEIDGEVVNDLQPKDRNIAMVFQNYALYPHLTVYENMAFALRLQKIPVERKDKNGEVILRLSKEDKNKIKKLQSEYSKVQKDKKLSDSEKDKKCKEIDEIINDLSKNAKPVYDYKKMSNDEIYQKVTNAAEVLGITDLLLRKPRALSGGQRQRVAIGRAMVRDSKVFLMDEPLSNLDAKLRNQMRAEIILLRKKIDTTFIYVTHDQTEAMTLGDRIVIMKLGKIQQVGTPTELFDMPKNLFVGEFIGAPKMNIFKTNLVYENGNYYVTPFGSKILVDGEKAQMLKDRNIESREILLGVRPEHLILANEKNENTISSVLEVNEMMGSENHLHVNAIDANPEAKNDSSNKVILRVPTLELSQEVKESLVPGKELYFTFSGKVMHFFDVETQNNILVD